MQVVLISTVSRIRVADNDIGINAVAILIDMAKWTWEALMRTETTRETESLPLRFIPCYKIVAALNRMFGRCTTDSVTELKQRCDSVRLLFLIT